MRVCSPGGLTLDTPKLLWREEPGFVTIAAQIAQTTGKRLGCLPARSRLGFLARPADVCMPIRRLHERLTVSAMCLFAVMQTGCLWKREAAVSPNTIVSRHLCRQGIAAMEHAAWDEAEPLLAKAVDVCPEDPDARSKYADLLWRKGEAAEAIRQMTEAIRLSPEDVQLRVRYGEMQLAVGNLDAARESAEWALDMDPKRAGAWALRGRLLARSKKPREALSDLHRAESLAPKNAAVRMEIAELYLGLREPDRALATLQSLSDHWSPQGEPAQVLSLKGKAYAAMRRYDDAANHLLLAANRGANDCETLYRLAEAQLRAGRRREAVAAAQKALAADPGHAASRHLLARLGIRSGGVY